MTDWDLKISDEVDFDQKSKILRKHYVIKEPFDKIYFHEMHLTEFVENMLETGLIIILHTADRKVECLPREKS